MWKPKGRQPIVRRGGIAPLTAVCMVIILALVAFAVDVSWMGLSQSQLQNAADAASLAGANRLGDNYAVWNLPNQSSSTKQGLVAATVASAQKAAIDCASYNSVAGQSQLVLLPSDVELGFTDNTGAYTSSSANGSNYPNTIKVCVRRDSTANTPVGLFFAPMFGVSGANMLASSSATLFAGNINTFQPPSGGGGGSSTIPVLPLSHDANSWNQFLENGSSLVDGNSHFDSGNGGPILKIHDGNNPSTSRCGLLSLNNVDLDQTSCSNWIHKGCSAADLSKLNGGSLISLAAHNPTKWDWCGKSSIPTTHVSDCNKNIGKTCYLPLHVPCKAPSTDKHNDTCGSWNHKSGWWGGGGCSAPGTYSGCDPTTSTYNTVQCVGVKICQKKNATASDSNCVYVQPSAFHHPCVVHDPPSVAPIGTHTTCVTSLSPPRCTGK